MNAELLNAYRWNRAHYVGNVYPRNRDYIRLNPASEALANARRDIAEGKKRYPASYGWNPAFKARGSDHMRWIEKPAACGLRFVGYADKINRLDHTGWYSDNDQSSTIRGVVFQMPGRNGKPLFVPGYDNADNGAADNGGPVCLSFEDVTEGEGVEFIKSPHGNYWTYESNPAKHDGARTAAGIADQLAQWCAESEREYQAALQAGGRFAELGAEIESVRATVKALLAERRAARANGESYPAICATIRQHVRAALHSIDKARQERRKLREGDYVSEWLPGFSTRDSTLRAAFNDGANETILPA